MILNVSGKTIESPTASDIQQAISNLQDNADSFVILSLGEMTYLQCIGDSSVGYIVEYQEGSTDQHFTTKDGHIDTSRTLTIFKMYADQNPDWKNQTSWEKMSW
ncbi:MAG: hypothetical protein MI748_04080 [Opitutales bacterium]|nr:hypothetical protein [Opitutales bacterium]